MSHEDWSYVSTHKSHIKNQPKGKRSNDIYMQLFIQALDWKVHEIISDFPSVSSETANRGCISCTGQKWQKWAALWTFGLHCCLQFSSSTAATARVNAERGQSTEREGKQWRNETRLVSELLPCSVGNFLHHKASPPHFLSSSPKKKGLFLIYWL